MRSGNILDLESGDEEQLDLFYLVDCVLDEIALAKQSSSKDKLVYDDPDSDDDIMPAATHDFYTPDLMDHIESPLPSFDSDQSFSSHEGSFTGGQRSSYHHVANQAPTSAEITELADQFFTEGEQTYDFFLQQQHNTTNGTATYTQTSKNNTRVLENECTDSNIELILPDDFATTTGQCSYQQNSDLLDRISENRKEAILKLNHQVGLSAGAMDLSKGFPKGFSNLQQYSDFVNTVSIASNGGDNKMASHQTISSAYHQQEVPQVSSFYEDDTSSDTTSSEFISWTCTHPENWNATEVLDWLYYSAERNGLDCSLLRGESFRTVTGEALCKMGLEEFCTLEPHYGQYLYRLFRQLINGLRFTPAVDTDFQEQSDLDSYSFYTSQQKQPLPEAFTARAITQEQCHRNIVRKGQSSTQTSPEVYQTYHQNSFEFASTSVPQTPHHQATATSPEPLMLHGYDYSSATQDFNSAILNGYDYQMDGYTMPERTKDRHDLANIAAIRSRYCGSMTAIRRRPGRPRIKSDPTEEEMRTQRAKKLKSQHLWEFIFDMLGNPAYNPSILKWENQHEGVFRFIQSESVAQLWGNLKSNDNMTYEKLSRAMRHYYKRGILERVEGRRLVYKFSRNTLQKMREKQIANAAK